MGVLRLNKKAIQLSVNFIVMLILAVSVFVGGLMFAGKFFGKAEVVRGALNSQTEQQLEKLLDSGSPVVMPIKKKEIFRNKFEPFGIGVVAQFKGTYSINVIEPTEAYAKDKSRITTTTNFPTIVMQVKEKKLDINEKWKTIIAVDVPKNAPRGTYVYTVWVGYTPDAGDSSPTAKSSKDNAYDHPLQFIVSVP